MRLKLSTVLCGIGWSAVAYHVYQGYGFEHAVGVLGFFAAAVGHAMKAGVLSTKPQP